MRRTLTLRLGRDAMDDDESEDESVADEEEMPPFASSGFFTFTLK